AVWVFTHVIEYTRPFGAWLGQYPSACRFLTYSTLVLEGLAPLLLFVPFATGRIRGAMFCVFAAFHLTLQSPIHIGIFQLICIVALTLFLPGGFWDGLARCVPAGVRARWAALGARASDAPRASGALARAGHRAVNAFLVLALGVILASNANSLVRN